jgi:hypothetical protein
VSGLAFLRKRAYDVLIEIIRHRAKTKGKTMNVDVDTKINFLNRKARKYQEFLRHGFKPILQAGGLIILEREDYTHIANISLSGSVFFPKLHFGTREKLV